MAFSGLGNSFPADGPIPDLGPFRPRFLEEITDGLRRYQQTYFAEQRGILVTEEVQDAGAFCCTGD